MKYSTLLSGRRLPIIYAYLSRAATQWVDNDPTDAIQNQLIQDFLNDQNPNFRRIGLFFLSNHPDADVDWTRSELLKEENYHQEVIQFEFYRLLKQDFQHLSSADQDHICKVFSNGPPYSEKVEQRAELLAEQENISVEEMKRHIVEY